MKKAKILSINKKKDFNTNDGKTLYVFDLELDNGDTGVIYKTKDNPYVSIDQEIKYTISERGTIKIEREDGGGFQQKRFSQPSDDRFYTKEEKSNIFDAKDLRITKLSCLNRSIDLVISDKINKDQWKEMANSFVEWVYDTEKHLPFSSNNQPPF
jgi:hypothetical protein